MGSRVGSGRVEIEMDRGSNAAGDSHCGKTFEFLQVLHSLHNLISSSAHSGVEFLLVFLEGDLVTVTILFPYRSILLIIHSRHLLTWRGRGSVHFLNTAYLLVRSLSTFSLISLSSDVLIS